VRGPQAQKKGLSSDLGEASRNGYCFTNVEECKDGGFRNFTFTMKVGRSALKQNSTQERVTWTACSIKREEAFHAAL